MGKLVEGMRRQAQRRSVKRHERRERIHRRRDERRGAPTYKYIQQTSRDKDMTRYADKRNYWTQRHQDRLEPHPRVPEGAQQQESPLPSNDPGYTSAAAAAADDDGGGTEEGAFQPANEAKKEKIKWLLIAGGVAAGAMVLSSA